MKLFGLILAGFVLSSCTYQRSDEEAKNYAIENLGLTHKKNTFIDNDGDFIPDINEDIVDKQIFNYPRLSINETKGIEINFNLDSNCSSSTCYLQKLKSKQNSQISNDILRKSIQDSSFFEGLPLYNSVSDIKDHHYFPFVEGLKGVELDSIENQPILNILFNIEARDIKYISKISNIIIEVGILSDEEYLSILKTSPKNSLGDAFVMNNEGSTVKSSAVPLSINQKLNLGDYDLERLRRLLLKRNHKITMKIIDFDYITENNSVNYMTDLIEGRLNERTTKLAKITFSSNKFTRTEYIIPQTVESIIKRLYPAALMNRTDIKELELLEETYDTEWIIERYTSKKRYPVDIRKNIVGGQKILVDYRTKRITHKSMRDEIQVESSNNEINISNVVEGDILDITISGKNQILTSYPTNTFKTLYKAKINNTSISQSSTGNLEFEELIESTELSKSIKILNELGELMSAKIYFIEGNNMAFLKNNTLRFRIHVKSEIIDNGNLRIIINDDEIKNNFYSKVPQTYKANRLSPAQIEAEKKRRMLERLRQTQDARDSRI